MTEVDLCRSHQAQIQTVFEEGLKRNWKKRDWIIVFDALFVAFFKNRYNRYNRFPFFQPSGNIPHFKQVLNTLKSLSIIVSPDIFNMRILILLWPWALLWSSLQMIFLISSFMNSMFARYWSVMWLVGERKTVLFSLIEHWFAKKTVTEIFLDVFIGLAFNSSAGFALFQVWLLTYYFYFSSKADKFCLFFWIIVFNFLFIQRGSWSLKILVSLGIKFVMILE